MIEESVRQASNGVDISANVSKTLQDIVERIGKTADFVKEIAISSQEQAHNIEEINSAITNMDGVTQQNAASAEESASAAQELNQQALQLQKTVSELDRMVGAAKINEARAKTAQGRRPAQPGPRTGDKARPQAARNESRERELELVS
jgi:methyl-accepting chemotaxis protein